MRRRRSIGRVGVLLALAVLTLLPATTRAEIRRPSVLVHAARSAVNQWYWWVDLDYLAELHAKGFDVDYTDEHPDLTWERVRQYDVLVIYVCPLERGPYYDNTPDLPPYRDEFIEIVEKFLDQGGGVFLMARSLNADETFRPLIERWGARIPHERIVESDPKRLAATPHMGPSQKLWFTDNVLDSEVSEGVEQVWLPLTPLYSAVQTMPIQVDDDWQVVLKGGASARTVPFGADEGTMTPPAGALRREGGVAEPDLFAIRTYKSGRIAFCSIWPQFSIGQGTRWLYDRRVLDKGVGDRPSNFGRLIENTLTWLATSVDGGRGVGGFTTDTRRLEPPNERPGVMEAFVERGRSRRITAESAMKTAHRRGALYRGVIGAQSSLGAGEGTVEEFARAAREAGLQFVVFLEELSRLTPAGLDRLVRETEEQSTKDLQLYPGYWLDTNTGNRIFLFGRGLEAPPPGLIVEGRLNQQYQDPTTGAYVDRWSPLIDWAGHRMMAGGSVNIGYFGFADRPRAQRVSDLRLYSMLALRLFRDGVLVEDNFDGYLRSAAGTIPPVPVAVHLLRSPASLARAAEENVGVTYAQASSIDSLWDALGYADQYAAPNVFAGGGPTIHAWPQARQFYTFAAENFVADAAWLPVPIRVGSPVGLSEIRLYDGTRLYRRFLLDGDREFERVLELPASVQRTLVLVAEDVEGGRVVSTALRMWKGGGLAPIFCGDRINHCDSNPLLAKGPGSIEVAATPKIDAGYTWDGGPRGQRPVMRLSGALRPTLVSSLGVEGDRGWAQRPVLELADEGAVRAGSILDTLYEEGVPVVNAWRTYGPLGGASKLFRAEVSLTEFDRPTVGPHPDRYPGMATRSGAAVSIFEIEVRFLEKQTVESLLLFVQDWYKGPFPVMLVHGRGTEVVKRYDLSPGKRPEEGPLLRTGDWFGVIGAEPSNLSLHVNRGAPLKLRFRGNDDLSTAFYGQPATVAVKPGDVEHFELLSVVDPLDAPRRGFERVMALASYLADPTGLEVRRGRFASTDERRATIGGLLEIAAADGAATVMASRPASPVDAPLPVRVGGLNPNWSAGVYLHRGYVLGNYGEGTNRYRAAGVDSDGRVYTGLFADHADRTEVTIGHPVVCDDDRALHPGHVARRPRGRGQLARVGQQPDGRTDRDDVPLGLPHAGARPRGAGPDGGARRLRRRALTGRSLRAEIVLTAPWSGADPVDGTVCARPWEAWTESRPRVSSGSVDIIAGVGRGGTN